MVAEEQHRHPILNAPTRVNPPAEYPHHAVSLHNAADMPPAGRKQMHLPLPTSQIGRPMLLYRDIAVVGTPVRLSLGLSSHVL